MNLPNTPQEQSQNMSPVREIPVDYLSLIENTEFVGMPSICYSEYLMMNCYLGGVGNITPEGEVMRDLLSGRTLFDLGCGSPLFSPVPLDLARKFGARQYVGVETESAHLELGGDGSSAAHLYPDTFTSQHPRRYQLSGMMNPASASVEQSLSVQRYCDSMLGFLTKIPQLEHGAVFLLCGIDPGRYDNSFPEYASAMAHEINRLAQPGDGVIIRDAFDGILQRALVKTGQFEYLTDERKKYLTIVMRKIG